VSASTSTSCGDHWQGRSSLRKTLDTMPLRCFNRWSIAGPAGTMRLDPANRHLKVFVNHR